MQNWATGARQPWTTPLSPLADRLPCIFFDLARNYPTYAGLILFAKDLIRWLPDAYVQYVRFP